MGIEELSFVDRNESFVVISTLLSEDESTGADIYIIFILRKKRH